MNLNEIENLVIAKKLEILGLSNLDKKVEKVVSSSSESSTNKSDDLVDFYNDDILFFEDRLLQEFLFYLKQNSFSKNEISECLSILKNEFLKGNFNHNSPNLITCFKCILKSKQTISVNVLSKFSKFDSYLVREFVASRNDLPFEIYSYLMKNETHSNVKMALFNNKRLLNQFRSFQLNSSMINFSPIKDPIKIEFFRI